MKTVGTSLARRAPTWSERERVRFELQRSFASLWGSAAAREVTKA